MLHPDVSGNARDELTETNVRKLSAEGWTSEAPEVDGEACHMCSEGLTLCSAEFSQCCRESSTLSSPSLCTESTSSLSFTEDMDFHDLSKCKTEGSHVDWRTLLEYAGDTIESWQERKVHEFLGVSEGDALQLLDELLDLRRALGEDLTLPERQPRQPACVPTTGFFSWLFSRQERSEEHSTRGAEVERAPRQAEDMLVYDFDKLKRIGVLGFGGFGSVSLVRSSETGQVLALKSISKGRLAQSHLACSPKVERDAMRACDSPFLVKLAATFNRGPRLYLLMEAALGGDLFMTYQQQKLFGSEVHAMFYTAGVVCALQHMHERQIMYRDLKMENVVLDAQGYPKLCDFGASSFKWSGSYTVCGTREYMAPEIITQKMHTCAVDWWALGVLLYELLMGSTPFTSEDPQELLALVKAGIKHLKLPSRPWSSLVQGLCHQDPQQRLPLLAGGIDNVKAHEWFMEVEFDWHDFESHTAPAPFVPERTTDVEDAQTKQEDPAESEELQEGHNFDVEDFEDATRRSVPSVRL